MKDLALFILLIFIAISCFFLVKTIIYEVFLNDEEGTYVDEDTVIDKNEPNVYDIPFESLEHMATVVIGGEATTDYQLKILARYNIEKDNSALKNENDDSNFSPPKIRIVGKEVWIGARKVVSTKSSSNITIYGNVEGDIKTGSGNVSVTTVNGNVTTGSGNVKYNSSKVKIVRGN